MANFFNRDNMIKIVIAVVLLASGIYLYLIDNQTWPFVLLSPLLILPIFRDLRILKDVDEKQTLDSHLSSHVALYLILALLVGEAFLRIMNRELVNPLFPIIIVLVFAVKTLMGLSFSFSFKKAGIFLGLVTGGLWVLVTGSMSLFHQLLIFPLLIGFAILISSLLALKFRVAGATILGLLGIILVFYPVPLSKFSHSVPTIVAWLVIFPTPALISSFLIIRHREEEDLSAVEIQAS